ncbi:MAG: fimbria/pilus outer membrane usher protein [Candidatus Dasytiphilus stammeri]
MKFSRIIEWLLFLVFFFINDVEGKINKNFLSSSTQLYLQLVINGNDSIQILPVKYNSRHFYMARESLNKIGLNSNQIKKIELNFIKNELPVDLVKNFITKYDQPMQRLFLDVPYFWLPEKTIIFQNNLIKNQKPAQSTFGALLNYNWNFTSFNNNQNGNSSLWSEIRLFNNIGVFSTTGILTIHQLHTNIQSYYIRNDTQISLNNQKHMLNYIIGDYNTDILSGFSPVRMAGIKVSRKFSLHPYFITYYLPKMKGYANMPSILDVYLNHSKIFSRLINPGRFTLVNNLGYFNGYNIATILTSDRLGRSKRVQIPLYIDTNLLNVGLTDFSLSLGYLRLNYGIKSFNYTSDMALSGYIRYGLLPWMTVNIIGESTKNFYNLGLGGDIKFFLLGLINFSWSKSNFSQKNKPTNFLLQSNLNSGQCRSLNCNYSGQQINLGYTSYNSLLSFNTQYSYRTGNYIELYNYQTNIIPKYNLGKHFFQINGNLHLSTCSNVSMSFLQTIEKSKTKLQEFTLSYSTSLGKNLNLWTSINKYKGTQNGYQAQLMLSMPLNIFGNTSLTTEINKDNHYFISQSWNRSIPSDEGIGWNIAYYKNNNNYLFNQAEMLWKNKYFSSHLGLYRMNNYSKIWCQLTGSVVAIGKYINFSPFINDGLVLVSTNGYPNIPIFYENRLIGKTNNKGYFLVSSVSSLYPSTITIDYRNIPLGVKVPEISKTFNVKEHSGYIVKFPFYRTQSAVFSVIDEYGNFLPQGSLVNIRGTSKMTWVGLEGEVFIEDIINNNILLITRSDNSTTCKVIVDISKTSHDKIFQPGLQLCQ